MRSVRGAVLVGVLLALSSCSEGSARCNNTDAGLVPGLRVEVHDEQGPVCDATVIAADGDYSEMLMKLGSSPTGCRYQGAYERAGTYTITVVSGERSKTVSGVIVRSDGCHVTSQMETIMLD